MEEVLETRDREEPWTSSVLSLNDPERLIPRVRSSREVALPPSGCPSPYRSKESCAGILFERLMLLLPEGMLYWHAWVGLNRLE